MDQPMYQVKVGTYVLVSNRNTYIRVHPFCLQLIPSIRNHDPNTILQKKSRSSTQQTSLQTDATQSINVTTESGIKSTKMIIRKQQKYFQELGKYSNPFLGMQQSLDFKQVHYFKILDQNENLTAETQLLSQISRLSLENFPRTIYSPKINQKQNQQSKTMFLINLIIDSEP